MQARPVWPSAVQALLLSAQRMQQLMPADGRQHNMAGRHVPGLMTCRGPEDEVLFKRVGAAHCCMPLGLQGLRVWLASSALHPGMPGVHRLRRARQPPPLGQYGSRST